MSVGGEDIQPIMLAHVFSDDRIVRITSINPENYDFETLVDASSAVRINGLNANDAHLAGQVMDGEGRCVFIQVPGIIGRISLITALENDTLDSVPVMPKSATKPNHDTVQADATQGLVGRLPDTETIYIASGMTRRLDQRVVESGLLNNPEFVALPPELPTDVITRLHRYALHSFTIGTEDFMNGVPDAAGITVVSTAGLEEEPGLITIALVHDPDEATLSFAKDLSAAETIQHPSRRLAAHFTVSPSGDLTVSGANAWNSPTGRVTGSKLPLLAIHTAQQVEFTDDIPTEFIPELDRFRTPSLPKNLLDRGGTGSIPSIAPKSKTVPALEAGPVAGIPALSAGKENEAETVKVLGDTDRDEPDSQATTPPGPYFEPAEVISFDNAAASIARSIAHEKGERVAPLERQRLGDDDLLDIDDLTIVLPNPVNGKSIGLRFPGSKTGRHHKK